MTELIVMGLLAAVCWIFRIAFITLVPAERLPAGLTRGLEFLAPAVLAAIAAVELVAVVRDGDLAGNAATAVAMAVVALVAYRWRNLSLTVAAGLVSIVIIDLFVLG
jgi:branched-subunit amino acid transport protein